MNRIIITLILAAALGLTVQVHPSAAENQMIKYLAVTGCQGQQAPGKSACYTYLKRRIVGHMQPGNALSSCKDWCTEWYGPATPAKNTSCKNGCQFLYSLDK